MINETFSQMADAFVKDAVDGTKSYYFSLGDVKKTVVVSGMECNITDGKTVEQADCVCKTSPEFFLRIWQDGYRPGMKDFMTGTIKSNDPSLLQTFLKCFGKE